MRSSVVFVDEPAEQIASVHPAWPRRVQLFRQGPWAGGSLRPRLATVAPPLPPPWRPPRCHDSRTWRCAAPSSSSPSSPAAMPPRTL